MPDAPQSGLPPYPWPLTPRDHYWQNCSPGGDTCVGSPGTPWVFKASELRNRLLALGAGASAVETLAQVLAYANSLSGRWNDQTCEAELDDPDDPDPRILWIAPDLESSVSVDAYRVVVHAALGTVEDLSHVFHLRPKSGVTQDTSAAGLAALAARVGAAWTAWWNDTTVTAGTSTSTKTFFSPALSYDKILVSYLTYPGGTAKPVTNTPTVTWNFSTPLAGTAPGTNVSLPNEVACCVTLLTDTSGKRTRGRFYLGGMDGSQWMYAQSLSSNQGMFQASPPQCVAGRFGVKVIDAVHLDATAQAEFNVLSRVGGSARGVGGIKVGLVPDSQRRRRFHQNENKSLVWGTAS